MRKAPPPTENGQSFNPRLLALVPYVTGPLAKGTRVGTWVYDVVTLVNGSAATTHNLGRKPTGFVPVYLSANVAWWHGDRSGWTATTAALNANGAATIEGFWI